MPKSVRCQSQDKVSPGGACAWYLHKLCFLGQLDCVPVSVIETSPLSTTLTAPQVCSISIGRVEEKEREGGAERRGEKESVKEMDGEEGESEIHSHPLLLRSDRGGLLWPWC